MPANIYDLVPVLMCDMLRIGCTLAVQIVQNVVTHENNDNGTPFHHYTMGHAFLFNQTKILAREKNAFRRKVIEGIHIANKKNSCVNIIAGKKIENMWMSLVQDLRLS